jgi:hypothetical protein
MAARSLVLQHTGFGMGEALASLQLLQPRCYAFLLPRNGIPPPLFDDLAL